MGTPRLATLRQFYGDVNAATFGPKALRVLQDHWANKGLARNTVNHNVSLVRRAFKWAASHEIIPIMVPHGLGMVEGLQAGRSAAREAKHIRPVPDEHVDAIRDFVAPPVCALIQLQRLTGARSLETRHPPDSHAPTQAVTRLLSNPQPPVVHKTLQDKHGCWGLPD